MGMVAGKWSISALSVELGISRRRVAKGCEGLEVIETKGKTRYYRMKSVVLSIFSAVDKDGGKLDLGHETARLKKLQADKTELEIGVLEKTLIPADLVRDDWAEFAGNCRSRLTSLAATAAPQVSGLGVIETQEIIQGLVDEALREIAKYGNDEPDKPVKRNKKRNIPKDGTPAKSNGKPVGRRKKSPVKRRKPRTGKVADK